MSTPSLPKGLVPLLSGYGYGAPGGVMATEVAGGRARYALDWDRGDQRFDVTLLLDRLQFSVWTAFFHHAIKKGAISFTMPLDSGFGLAPHLVNIVPGSYSVANVNFRTASIAFTVEAESQAYLMDEEEGLGLVDLYAEYGASSSDLLQRIATFATVDSLVLDF